MIYTGPAVEIPDSPPVSFVLHRARELSTKPALIDGLTGQELTYGALADAVVIPSPNEEAGEVPKAFVVLKPDRAGSPDGPCRPTGGAAQEDPAGRDHRRDPQVGIRQDPPPQAGRARAREGERRLSLA